MQTDLPLFQRHQIEVIARVTPHAMAGHMLNTSVLAIALAGSIPTADLAIWCTYSSAIALLVLYRHVRNRGRAPASFRRAAHRATVYAFLLALPWSTMTVLHLGAFGREQELILIALVVGMAASGTVLLSALPSAAFSYMSGILIPSAVKCLFLLDQKVYLLLGVLAVSYWWFLAALITKVAREISERRQADIALTGSETRLQEALTAGQVVAFSWDPETGHSHRSENALQILGLGPQGGTGLPANNFLARVHPEDRQSFVAQIKRLSPQNPSYSAFFRFTRPDGQQAWLEETGKAEFDADGGRYVRLKGLTRDVTERKQSEKKLHARERESRLLLEALAERTTQLALAEKSALVGSFAYDVDADTLTISDGYAAIHGFPNETRQIARSRWLAGVHPEDRARLDELRSRNFCTQSPEYTVDFRIVHSGGEVRWIEGRAFVGYRDDGSPRRVVGVNIDVTERKRAEAALEESRARYRALYDDNPSMYFTVDASGTVLSVNEFGARQLGYTPAELVGQSVLKVIHQEDHEAARQHLASCAESPGTVTTTELRKVRRDGSIIWVRETARAMPASAEKQMIVLVVCEEITGRKRTEWLLAERSMQLALAGKAARVGSYAYDVGADTIQVDEGYAALLGLPEGTTCAPRSEWKARVHPEDLAWIETDLSRAFRDRRYEYGKEYRIIRPGGEVRWLESRSSISYDGEGRPLRVVGVNIDISERKKAELILAERNIQLALAGKAALVGSYAYDTDTEMMQISEGYGAIHGFPEGTREMARSECLAGLHPDDIERVEQSRSEAFRAGRREYNAEYCILRAGEVRWVETRCFIAYDSEGRPHRVVGVSIDITERKRVEEQQRRLVAELDHRVKNVLATVQAVAAHTMRASSSMEQFSAALDGRIRSMGSTHELLSHRRWLGIPLAELVERELAPYATGSNTEIGGPDVMLSAEAGQTMAMVLHELVTNAAKHGALSKPDGRVSVRWYRLLNGDADARLCIEWQETGGPAVQALERSGYGTEVIRGLLPYELGGKVDLTFPTEGVRCRLDIPLSQLTGGDRPDRHIQ